jgi:hypothetical protein
VAFTPSPPVALNLNHQTRIRTLYPDQNLMRPGSSSSSSVTDWDNGHATVLRRQPLPSLPATVLERLSVRTEIGNTSSRKLRHSVATSEDICPQNDATQTTEAHPQNLRNLATSLTSLTRELTPTISEVYHERNLGLGLAPSLSKLLEEVGTVPENCEQPQSAKTGNQQSWIQNETELCRRDEADGRSIAESQCSAASSNKIPRKAPAPPV